MRSKSRSLVSFVPGLAVAFACTALALPAAAESDDAPTDAKSAGAATVASASPQSLPLYVPPKVGKPARTVGGGSRGPGDGLADLYVLVPDHVGQTTSEQPSLYWFIDEVPAAPLRIAFTLLDADGIDPLVQVTLPRPERAGIHRIRLADYAVKLEPGVEYEWSISLVPDESARSRDIVSTGFIDRVEAPGDLAAELAKSGPEGSARVYAARGLWYDALTALDEQISARPGDAQLTAARASLLRQVGLEDVANSKL